MFRGRFEHSFDEKGRIAVPVRFRDVLLSTSSKPTLVVTNLDQCLVAYPLAEWEKLEAKIAGLPQFDGRVVAFQRYFVSGATECPLDKAGRILIPNNLRELAAIDKDCIFGGLITKIEIWAKQRWDLLFKELTGQFAKMTTELDRLGVQV